MGRLSSQQVRSFEEEGYLVVDDVFDPADLTPLRREFEEQIDREIRRLHAAGELGDTHAHEPFETRLARIQADDPKNATAVMRALQGRAGGGPRGRAMFDVIVHPKLLAVVESLVGPEIVGSSVYRIRPKLPGLSGGVVPWHQDSGYFAELCDRNMIVTCWVPLVDATEENGCMQVMPRAHRQGILNHHTGGNAGFLVILDDDLPPQRAPLVTAECPLGGVVLLTNMTPHCSTPNRSQVIRWSVDLRYQGAEAPNNAALWPDETPGAVQSPEVNMACYPPEADFLVQSRLHPERVATFEEFVRRRDTFDRVTNIAYPQRKWVPVPA